MSQPGTKQSIIEAARMKKDVTEEELDREDTIMHYLYLVYRKNIF
jgi:hypothetical protein